MFNRIAIIGLGLIGASIAKAVKDNNLSHEVIGFDKENKNTSNALKDKVITDIGDLKAFTGENLELIIVATNLASYPDIADILRTAKLSPNIIISDIGSVKLYPLQIFAEFSDSFIATHPIAGKEISGYQAAAADLFKNKKVIICTDNDPNLEKLKIIENFWHKIGATTYNLSATFHDKIYASISHLPQALIYAENKIINVPIDNEIFSKHLRLASSNIILWDEIFKYNKEFLLPLLEKARELVFTINDDDIKKAKEIRQTISQAPNSEQNITLPDISYIVATILVKLASNIELSGSGFKDSTECLLNYKKLTNDKLSIADRENLSLSIKQLELDICL